MSRVTDFYGLLTEHGYKEAIIQFAERELDKECKGKKPSEDYIYRKVEMLMLEFPDPRIPVDAFHDLAVPVLRAADPRNGCGTYGE